MNERLAMEILSNSNLQNFMVQYIAEKIYSEANKQWILYLISWNAKEEKYDLREWASGHEKMGKGATLSNE